LPKSFREPAAAAQFLFRFQIYIRIRCALKQHFTIVTELSRLQRGAVHHTSTLDEIGRVGDRDLGIDMVKLPVGALLALVCLSPTAMAQDLKPVKPVIVASAATGHETLDASMARLAMKAALQPSAPPTREELLGVIVLMSLRQQRASGT
jgi:hypothetical protein